MKRDSRAKGEYTHIVHPIPPLYDSESYVLILGSLPSVKSREGMFFYHHPQNRFWKMLALVLEDELPKTIEEKTAFLHRHHIALWDSIHECDIIGSSDASIRNVVPNDIRMILDAAPIERILTNGEKSYRMYETWIRPMTGRESVRCPSTSPANAQYSLEQVAKQWKFALLEGNLLEKLKTE